MQTPVNNLNTDTVNIAATEVLNFWSETRTYLKQNIKTPQLGWPNGQAEATVGTAHVLSVQRRGLRYTLNDITQVNMEYIVTDAAEWRGTHVTGLP